MERVLAFQLCLGVWRGGGGVCGVEGQWHFKVTGTSSQVWSWLAWGDYCVPECVCGKGDLVPYIFGCSQGVAHSRLWLGFYIYSLPHPVCEHPYKASQWSPAREDQKPPKQLASTSPQRLHPHWPLPFRNKYTMYFRILLQPLLLWGLLLNSQLSVRWVHSVWDVRRL